VEEEKKQEKDALTKSDLISFAFEVGGSIALPLVILALGGRLLDKHFDTSPLFLILGLLLSLISTAYLISKKVKKFSNF
jgi:F0F1-type ATP synthase assembly protein I